MPRFSPEFLEELKSRLRPSDVIGKKVKLKKRGETWWGLSPFKEEKTPSFTVSDRRGSYHCFATQQHGNIFDFVMATERLSFPEAVERLAKEAGLELPRGGAEDAERHQRKKGLLDACEDAAKFFEATLKRATGREGLDYLQRRGVSEASIRDFRLGFAPESRTALKDQLVNKGYTEEILLEAGLLARPEEGGASYDRFRRRVMFPIANAKGEIIAFGGRALDPEARAKYLNSPETPLFHKSDILYNYGPARAAAATSKGPLIVCEGYMDVIALAGAGIGTAVAPLGTALTENQLQLLWRQCDEPVLCFDGDKAGVAAAYRSLDRALALLKPGKSLNYVFLPDGQDPDDLVRAGGAAAFKEAMKAAAPLAETLWRRETEARPLDTPEKKAALRAGLRDLIATIADKDVKTAYGADFTRRLNEAFAPPRRQAYAPREEAHAARGRQGPWRGQKASPTPSPELRRRGAPSNWSREASLVVAVLNHPELAERRESDLLGLHLSDQGLERLLKAVLEALIAAPALDREGLNAHLHGTDAAKTLERVLSDVALNTQTFLRPETGLDEVEKGWSDALRHHLIATEARRAMSDSAAQSFMLGEEVWKAAVNAREELVNAKAEQEVSASDRDVSSREFDDRLERMRQAVSAKKRR